MQPKHQRGQRPDAASLVVREAVVLGRRKRRRPVEAAPAAATAQQPRNRLPDTLGRGKRLVDMGLLLPFLEQKLC